MLILLIDGVSNVGVLELLCVVEVVCVEGVCIYMVVFGGDGSMCLFGILIFID